MSAIYQNIPEPIPPTTLVSGAVRVATLTTDGPAGDCGAMLGRYKQPKPSAPMSISTKGGNGELPWERGVVIDTNVFTRVNGTGPPMRRFAMCSSESTGREQRGEPNRRNSLKKNVTNFINIMQETQNINSI